MARATATAKASSSGGTARTPRGVSCLEVYRASPLERIRMIRHGLRAAEAKRILEALSIGQGAALKALDLPVATVNKKAKQGQSLTASETERVLGVARLIGQVEAMVAESGNPKGFDPAAWTSRWLNDPLPALGGARPIELMNTMEGQTLVAVTLARVQSGAYA